MSLGLRLTPRERFRGSSNPKNHRISLPQHRKRTAETMKSPQRQLGPQAHDADSMSRRNGFQASAPQVRVENRFRGSGCEVPSRRECDSSNDETMHDGPTDLRAFTFS